MTIRSKWDVLQESKMKAWNEYISLQNQMTGLVNTPFDDGSRYCPTCSEPLPTEAAFAKHFLVDDERYLNIGNCPTRYNNGKLMPSLFNSWASTDLWDEAHELNETKDKLKAEGTPITLSDYNKLGNIATVGREGLIRYTCTECGGAYYSDEPEATTCNKCTLEASRRDGMRY